MKIKIFDWNVRIFELFAILMGGFYIGVFIRLLTDNNMENAINLLSVSITFWSFLILAVLFRIGDMVHGKETDRMLKEMKKMQDDFAEETRKEFHWQLANPEVTPKNE
jgi:hypothetical protein